MKRDVKATMRKSGISNMFSCLFLGTLLVLCSACSSLDEPSNDDTTVLEIWDSFKFEEHELFVRLGDEFAEEYQRRSGKKISFAVERVPYDDMVGNLRNACMTHTSPDMAFIDSLKVVNMAYGRAILPLDPIGGENIDILRKEYLPGPFDQGVIRIGKEQQLYGLPGQTTCLALFWNKKLFRESADALRAAGLDPERAPRDWDELIEYGKILTVPEKSQYAFAKSNKLWFNYPFYKIYGVEFLQVDADGDLKWTMNSPRGVRAVEKMAPLYLEEKVEASAWMPGALTDDQGFLNEKYAMIVSGPWMVERFEQSGIDFGVALFPRISREEAERIGIVSPTDSDEVYRERCPSATSIGGQHLVVLRECERPELAYRFIRHFTSRDIQRRWALELSQIPVVRDALREEDDIPEYLRCFLEQIQYAKPFPQIPMFEVLELDIVNPAMDLVLSGRKTPEETLSMIEKSVQVKILDVIERDMKT